MEQNTSTPEYVKCTRCRNVHAVEERKEVYENGWNVSVCPRCSCRSFYNLDKIENVSRRKEGHWINVK